MRSAFPAVVVVVVSFGLFTCMPAPNFVNAQPTRPATRAVRADADGVLRWSDTGDEVALFGVNYCLPSASDYRAAGHVTDDRKHVTDVDLAHLARMGFDGVRLSFWGDYENSDAAGNLLVNDHLDLLCYVVAKARERGIALMLSPIVLHSSQWPDAMDEKAPGFAEHFPKRDMGLDPQAIAAQANYLGQLLNHVNPYTGVALKDEPAIVLVELVNEPWHHSRDVDVSVRYIDALAGAVRATGCDAVLLHNVSQDFGIAGSIRRSKAQGVTLGWYPTGLVAGRTHRGNFLRTVDSYPPMLRPELAGLPSAVYEFDAADTMTATMYPAMARAFREAGAQFAAMFAYDMIATAPCNLGWQTHYLNLVHTPRKAVSAAIAAEAMRRLPRGGAYGPYPQNTRFGDFRVSYEQDLSELVAADAFMHAGTTDSAPPHPERLTRIVGCGSSPIVGYEGMGSYFLDKLRDGVWRLEVYPDALIVSDPYEKPSRDKVVSRVVWREWPMRVSLPDLGPSFAVRALAGSDAEPSRATDGRFTASPGVFLLAARDDDAQRDLPDRVGFLGIAEYHAPAAPALPPDVELTAPAEVATDAPVTVTARVIDANAPDDVVLSIAAADGGAGGSRRIPMAHAGGYDYRAELPAGFLPPGTYAYRAAVVSGDATAEFPVRGDRRLRVVEPTAPLRLFDPATDVPLLDYSRSGGPGRRRAGPTTVPASAPDAVAFRFETAAARGRLPRDYTASLFVGDRIAARRQGMDGARALVLKARGLGAGHAVHVTLVEADGTSWSARVAPGASWTDLPIAVSDFRIARGVMLPQGYPGDWAYWLDPADGRGGADDRPRLGSVERVQFSLRADGQDPATAASTRPATGPADADAYGVEIESVTLTFE